MATNSNDKIVLNEYPLWLWPIGLGTAVSTAWIPETTWERLLFALIGLALIGFDSILTFTVDHRGGTLKLHYRSLLRVSTKAYPLSEICFVNVAEDSEGERMYRVELILRSGQAVPLRNGYSVGKARKDRLAQRLRSVLRVGSEVPATGIALRP